MEERTMMPEEIAEKMRKPDFNLSRCARETGLHLNSVRYFRDNPSYDQTKWRTIKALSEYCKTVV